MTTNKELIEEILNDLPSADELRRIIFSQGSVEQEMIAMLGKVAEIQEKLVKRVNNNTEMSHQLAAVYRNDQEALVSAFNNIIQRVEILERTLTLFFQSPKSAEGN